MPGFHPASDLAFDPRYRGNPNGPNGAPLTAEQRAAWGLDETPGALQTTLPPTDWPAIYAGIRRGAPHEIVFQIGRHVRKDPRCSPASGPGPETVPFACTPVENVAAALAQSHGLTNEAAAAALDEILDDVARHLDIPVSDLYGRPDWLKPTVTLALISALGLETAMADQPVNADQLVGEIMRAHNCRSVIAKGEYLEATAKITTELGGPGHLYRRPGQLHAQVAAELRRRLIDTEDGQA